DAQSRAHLILHLGWEGEKILFRRADPIERLFADDPRTRHVCLSQNWDRWSSLSLRPRLQRRASPLPPLPHIDKPSRDRRRRRHRRRDEVGAALVALAALKIAVRGRGAALARRELVGV